MTNFDLLQYIGQAEDKYIMESRRRPKKYSPLRRYLPQVVAACLILCVAGSAVGLGIKYGGGRMGSAAAESTLADAPAVWAAPAEGEAPAAPAAESAAGAEAKPVSAYDVTLLASAQYPEGFAYEDTDAETEVWTSNAVSDDTSVSVLAFSYATAAKVLQNCEGSGCFSPLSLYQALAVLADGAQGETQTELLSLLGMPDADTLREQSGMLYRRTYVDNEINRLTISNALWLDETAADSTPIDYNRQWVMNAATNYYADVYQAEFSQPDTAQAMGAWIAEKTGGSLRPTLNVSPDTALSLVSTLRYKTQWAYSFDVEDTKPGDFTTDSGLVVQTEYMHGKEHTLYQQTEEYTLCYLLQDKGEMIIVLPQEGVDVDDLLTEEKLWEIYGDTRDYARFSPCDTNWSVPKFDTTTTNQFTDILTELGISSAFGPSADFSGISDTPLTLGPVQQGIHLSINEDGVQAMDFTEQTYLDYDPMARPTIDMDLNRPFIYMITTKGHTPLFLGVIRNPMG